VNLRAVGERIMAAAPKLGRSRLVLVDGPSNAGKTTFAYALAGTIPAEIVHTDDLLDGWDDQFTYWNRLERNVLHPRRRHVDPVANEPSLEPVVGDWIDVPPAGVLIVEGVGAGRAQARAEASLTIFVDAPLPVREARSLARDGAAMQEHLRRWRHREELHFGADATKWCADVVIGSAA